MSLITYSCSTENDPLGFANPSGDIFPLQIGNKWDYVSLYFDSKSELIDSSFDSEEIISSYEKDGKEWFSFASSWFQYSKQTDGIWVKHTQAPDEAQPELVYKFPTYQFENYSNVTVISMDKTIKIGLGYYRTIQYRLSIDDGYTDLFLCPGIGLIARTKVKKDSNGKFYLARKKELLSYTIK